LTLLDDFAGTSSVDIPMSEGPVNLNWGPIMKHINESPYEFFQQGGWSFLGGAGGAAVSFSRVNWSQSELCCQSDHSDNSESESEFEADEDDFAADSSDDESDFAVSAGSDESGSDFGDDGDSDGRSFVMHNLNLVFKFAGDDWDELERKAAKCMGSR
jgi:nucleosome binding factor SPN SPT16 subunit